MQLVVLFCSSVFPFKAAYDHYEGGRNSHVACRRIEEIISEWKYNVLNNLRATNSEPSLEQQWSTCFTGLQSAAGISTPTNAKLREHVLIEAWQPCTESVPKVFDSNLGHLTHHFKTKILSHIEAGMKDIVVILAYRMSCLSEAMHFHLLRLQFCSQDHTLRQRLYHYIQQRLWSSKSHWCINFHI